MSEPLSDILPAFFVKLKSLSQGWERSIRPRPLRQPPPPFSPCHHLVSAIKVTVVHPFSSSWEIGLMTSRSREFEANLHRNRLGRSSVIFWKISAPIDKFWKVTREWRFSRRECEMAREPFSWEVGFSRARVERIDECFRWEAGGYQAFGSRESFFFFFLKRGFIFLDFDFRPGVW